MSSIKQLLTNRKVINSIVYYSCLYLYPIPTNIYTLVKKFY